MNEEIFVKSEIKDEPIEDLSLTEHHGDIEDNISNVNGTKINYESINIDCGDTTEDVKAPGDFENVMIEENPWNAEYNIPIKKELDNSLLSSVECTDSTLNALESNFDAGENKNESTKIDIVDIKKIKNVNCHRSNEDLKSTEPSAKRGNLNKQSSVNKKLHQCDVCLRHTKMADEDLFTLDLDENGDNFDDDSHPTFELSSSTQKKKTTQPKKRQIKPKVCSDWSDDEIYRLISCVKCVPMLWNAKDEKYRNKIERQSAWKHISETDFDGKFNETQLMAKWSNMRIQYRSYFAKYRKTKTGQGSNEPVKWKFYEAMDFVDRAEEEQTATTVSNLMNADERSLDSPFDQSSTPHVSKRRRLSQSSSVTPTSSSAAYIVAEGMRDTVNQMKEQRQKREDEFDAFGKYVATELRSLSDPNSARRVRFKVARCLMDCIEDENQSTNQVYFQQESSK